MNTKRIKCILTGGCKFKSSDTESKCNDKEKCSPLYEEIGKCYDRIDYGNGTHINAYIVKKCKICGNITAKTVYSNEFTRYTSPVRVDDCVKKLIAKGYVDKVDFFLEHENDNIPWK